MKVFYLLILVFLVSCSSEKDETITNAIPQKKQTPFEIIFTNSTPIFNGYELGDDVSEDIIIKDSLPNSSSFSSSILLSEGKINKIELEIHIEDDFESKNLIESIVDKYNKHLNYTKIASNFVTWTYTAKGNLPAEIVLIYEEDLKTISLDIGYKSQR